VNIGINPPKIGTVTVPSIGVSIGQ
jgi:hypothetical protein